VNGAVVNVWSALSSGGWSAEGGLAGLSAAVGLLIVLGRLPWRRTPTLEQRLAPYVRDAVPPGQRAAWAPATPLGVVERLLAPVMSGGIRWAEAISGGPGTARRRLEQLGAPITVEQFRAQQVVWGVLGAVAGGVVGLVLGAGRGMPVVPVLGLLVVGGLLGVLGRDRVLSAQVGRREQRMLAEFPTVAELLALSVAAGEGAVGALDRVSRTCRGELSSELRRTLADARTGASLVEALEGMAARTSLPSVARFEIGRARGRGRGEGTW
jgi:tight adherence protein C